MQNKQSNFLDPKTLLAIILSGLVFVLYSSYLNKKYPKKDAPTNAVSTTSPEKKQATTETTTTTTTAAEVTTNNVKPIKEVVAEKVIEQTVKYEDENMRLTISSKGMGFTNYELKKYMNREHTIKKLGYTTADVSSLQTNLIGRRNPLYFNLQKTSSNTIVGTASFNGMQITKTYVINSSDYGIDTTIKVVNPTDSFDGVETLLSQKVQAPKSNGFLPGSNFDQSQLFTMFESTDEREILPSSEVFSKRYDKVSLASLGEQYFAQAIVDRSNVLPDLKVSSQVFPIEDDETYAHTVAKVQHPVLDKKQNFTVKYLAYLGPKSIDILKAADAALPNVIDFGFFSFLATPLSKLLKWLHSMMGNWGFAIIFLTIIVRFVLLPLHLVSYKSMRNMSKISPLMKEINEKYKDDPQLRGQKMMEIYKENKVNPLSGCLPMFLQIPVFFALYQVIGQSIELYQEPFIFWIKDLSIADPIYILPILMGITMTAQMKLTPSTMDPKQAKIMMFMPIMFTFFMLPLPSGLTLYFFISGLFGIIQQYLMRDRSTQTNAKAVVAN